MKRRLALLALVVAVGCKKDGEGPDKAIPDELKPTQAKVDPAKVKVAPLFAHVPADAPYLLASVEPVSLDYYAKLKSGLGPMFSQMLAQKRQYADASDGDKLFDAIMSELDGKLDAKGFESLGLSAQPRFALYGLGLAPIVFRLEIKDEKVLLATVERVATKAGKTLPAPVTQDGKTFWRMDKNDGYGIIGIFDGHLVGAAGPTKEMDAKLPLILGTQKPPQSMADGKVLFDLMSKHGFGPNLIGFADSRKIASQAIALSGKQLPQVCVAEIDRLAAKVPRVVLGYTEISTKRASGGVVVELEPSLLAEVVALKTEVPSLGTAMSDKPLMAMGGGIDLSKAQALAQKTVGSFGKLGDLCQLPDLIEGTQRAVDKLSQPLPEAAKTITGAVIALHALEMGAQSPVPTKLDAFGMISATSTQPLVDLAKQAMPLDQIGVKTDGTLNKVAIPGGMVPFDVYAGIAGKAIVVATGAKGEALAQKGLNGAANGKAPFFVATYDYARFAELQTKFAQLGGGYDDDPAMKANIAMQAGIAKMFDRGSFSFDATDQGLVMWGSIDMK